MVSKPHKMYTKSKNKKKQNSEQLQSARETFQNSWKESVEKQQMTRGFAQHYIPIQTPVPQQWKKPHPALTCHFKSTTVLFIQWKCMRSRIAGVNSAESSPIPASAP